MRDADFTQDPVEGVPYRFHLSDASKTEERGKMPRLHRLAVWKNRHMGGSYPMFVVSGKGSGAWNDQRWGSA